MSALIRDAPVGQLVRLITGNKHLQYPEEMTDFQVPEELLVSSSKPMNSSNQPPATAANSTEPIAQRKTTPSYIPPNATVLVDWYGDDDPDNPQNWSTAKKTVVVTQIYLYTLAVYMGSSIIVPSIPTLVGNMGVSENTAALGISLYVFGYGAGPLLFAPLSEIPVVGRNPPYVATLGIFVIVSIPAALVNNFSAFVVLRFLQGFFGSPCLATGAASIGDIYHPLKLPYYLCGWAAAAQSGPAIGPIISGFSVPATNWHWSLWEILWLAGPVYVCILLFLPETHGPNILLRRASRLRRVTGYRNIKSQSEIDQEKLTVREIIVSNLWRPLQINVLDPSVLFTSLYTALMYGTFYSFFEAFPKVYATGYGIGSPTQGYGMNFGEIGLIFLSITIGVLVGCVIYMIYINKVFIPEVMTIGLGEPERRLVPALPAVLLIPVGLLLFAWTAESAPRIHWIVPTTGIFIWSAGVLILFQCIFIYIPLSYPKYAASLFAGNDFARSTVAAAAIHIATPLYNNLGIGKGVTLLAGLSVGGIIGIFVLWIYGKSLRARSRFTGT